MAEYHAEAGRLGGLTTKRNQGGPDFYRRIGSLGGKATMERHGHRYDELRRKGGETTKALHGLQHHQRIAAKSAAIKQARIRSRNEVIAALMADGWKIPTIIKLTLDDLPKLQDRYGELLQRYLSERPQSDSNLLFLSQSGKPLTLANTYHVMERFHRQQQVPQ